MNSRPEVPSGPGGGSASDAPVDEPLLDAALTVLDLAPHSCPGGPTSCLAYHRLWPWLRLLGLASSPSRHGEFFAAHLRAVRRPEPVDVLISGCADQSMLAHVAVSLQPVRATVVDMCRTPLELCERFAADHDGIDLNVVQDDVRRLPVGRFDLVCTHSFLSQFPPDERPAVAGAWRRLVAPDGRVTTTTRLDSAGTGGAFDERAGAAFVERVVHAASADEREAVRAHAEDLRPIADAYVCSLRVHPVASTAELEDLFRAAGFGRVQVTARLIDGESPSRSGPGVRQAADYAEVVAAP